jgi:HD superfamily phosphohydrolase
MGGDMTEELAQGQQVGGFTIGELLGEGDFAKAYAAETDTGSTVALKLLHVDKGDAVERLTAETAALQRFAHRGIPAYVSDGTLDGRPYLAMELAPGRSLRSRIAEHRARNSYYSDLEALWIGQALLQILTYIQLPSQSATLGWVHRDIKDANVLVNDALDRVTLIDYGFCKENGASDRRLSDSFFRAGAARYSPPAKLESPADARATHDVFAVGVLLYQMVTNEFPWTVATGAVGQLRELMDSEPAVRVRELNSTVRRDVSEFIHELINTSDLYRPSAESALSTCSALIDALESDLDVASSPILSRPLQFDRVWRDPLYGDIRLTKYEMQVIDTPEVQRLRYMKQLGLTYLVYDSARHSRLSHSVGSLKRVEDILSSIEKIEGVTVDHETRQSARLYALIHDVTHVPVGHTLEDEYGLFTRHDLNVERIDRLVFDSSRSGLAALLMESEWGREVRKQFDPDSTVHARSDVSELVAGPVGADLLDYIDRDAYFCGLDHRVDSAIMRQMRIVGDKSGTNDRHVVSLVRGSYGMRVDREFALESLYSERYAMFLKVYAHKTKLKASALLAKALSISLTAGRKAPFGEQDIEWMSDSQLMSNVASRRRQNERESILIAKLRRRVLPRAVYRAALLTPEERHESSYRDRRRELQSDGDLGLFPLERRLEVEDQLAKAAGLKADQVFVYAALSAPGFKKTQHHRFLVDDSGILSAPASGWFNRIKALHLGLWDLWVLVDREVEASEAIRLGHSAQERFGFANQIDLPVRQGLLF